MDKFPLTSGNCPCMRVQHTAHKYSRVRYTSGAGACVYLINVSLWLNKCILASEMLHFSGVVYDLISLDYLTRSYRI